MDDGLQENRGDEDGDVVYELEAAAHEEAEAKANDEWTEYRKVFFGKAASIWLNLNFPISIGRKAEGRLRFENKEIG